MKPRNNAYLQNARKRIIKALKQKDLEDSKKISKLMDDYIIDVETYDNNMRLHDSEK